MLLKYVSSLAPHFFVGPNVAPHFLHARNATDWLAKIHNTTTCDQHYHPFRARKFFILQQYAVTRKILLHQSASFCTVPNSLATHKTTNTNKWQI